MLSIKDVETKKLSSAPSSAPWLTVSYATRGIVRYTLYRTVHSVSYSILYRTVYSVSYGTLGIVRYTHSNILTHLY